MESRGRETAVQEKQSWEERVRGKQALKWAPTRPNQTGPWGGDGPEYC